MDMPGGYERRAKDAIEAVRKAKLYQQREQAAVTVGRNTNQDFIAFKQNFLGNLTLLREKLLSVFTSNSMNLDELYQMPKAIFSDMQYEMDAILYLNAVYTSDYFVIEHCLRVGLLANLFAKWLSLDAEMVKDATVAGFVHDIGMLEVPVEIITKEGSLTETERLIIREHTVRGQFIMMNKGVKPSIVDVVRSHHERFDGSGYPAAKKGREINYLTSLISIVDVFDSMTSNRPYSLAVCPFEVINHLEKNMIDKFDPSLLYIFLENIPYMYKNSLVRLSNGETAIIVFINKNNKTAPIVQLLRDDQFVDLATQRDIVIESLL